MLSAERGAAKNTLSAYRRDLEDFLAQIFNRGRDAGTASSEDILSYLQLLSKRGLAASSRARKLSALRQFFRFLYTEGLRNDDPAASLESPKPDRPLPKILSVDDVDLLLETAQSRAQKARGPKRLKALQAALSDGNSLCIRPAGERTCVSCRAWRSGKGSAS